MPSAGQDFYSQHIGCFVSPHGFGHAARSAGVIEAIHQYNQNVVLLPHHSEFYHPDLVNASDAVVGKVGYSTLAEVDTAGVPFGHISRDGFRESAQLVAYIQKKWPACRLMKTIFTTADGWTGCRSFWKCPGCSAADRTGRRRLRNISVNCWTTAMRTA